VQHLFLSTMFYCFWISWCYSNWYMVGNVVGWGGLRESTLSAKMMWSQSVLEVSSNICSLCWSLDRRSGPGYSVCIAAVFIKLQCKLWVPYMLHV
jgi:hypothetical protein